MGDDRVGSDKGALILERVGTAVGKGVEKKKKGDDEKLTNTQDDFLNQSRGVPKSSLMSPLSAETTSPGSYNQGTLQPDPKTRPDAD